MFSLFSIWFFSMSTFSGHSVIISFIFERDSSWWNGLLQNVKNAFRLCFFPSSSFAQRACGSLFSCRLIEKTLYLLLKCLFETFFLPPLNKHGTASCCCQIWILIWNLVSRSLICDILWEVHPCCLPIFREDVDMIVASWVKFQDVNWCCSSIY